MIIFLHLKILREIIFQRLFETGEGVKPHFTTVSKEFHTFCLRRGYFYLIFNDNISCTYFVGLSKYQASFTDISCFSVHYTALKSKMSTKSSENGLITSRLWQGSSMAEYCQSHSIVSIVSKYNGEMSVTDNILGTTALSRQEASTEIEANDYTWIRRESVLLQRNRARDKFIQSFKIIISVDKV